MEIDLIVKIGGSCLSDKRLLFKALQTKKPDDIQAALKVNEEAIDNIAKELSQVYQHTKSMIILTGVGAPGHFTVLKHDLHKGNNGTFEQHLGLLEAQIAVNNLRQAVLKAFLKYKLPVVQVYASSIYQSDKMRIINGCTDNFEKFLNTEIIPVISGDMVPDLTMGYSVLSGDQILLDLARKYKPKKIVFGSDVDGVFDCDPKTNNNAKLIKNISHQDIGGLLVQLSGSDASGQMKGKLTEIKNLLDNGFNNIIVLNLLKPGQLLAAVLGEEGNFTKIGQID